MLNIDDNENYIEEDHLMVNDHLVDDSSRQGQPDPHILWPCLPFHSVRLLDVHLVHLGHDHYDWSKYNDWPASS